MEKIQQNQKTSRSNSNEEERDNEATGFAIPAIPSFSTLTLPGSLTPPPLQLEATTGKGKVVEENNSFPPINKTSIQLKGHGMGCGCSQCTGITQFKFDQKKENPSFANTGNSNLPEGNIQMVQESMPSNIIQRAIWNYDGNNWSDGNQNGNPPGLPPGNYNKGDHFDENSGKVFSGGNADLLGNPNRMIGYQNASEDEKSRLKEGLALAKLKLDRVKKLVKDDEINLRGGGNQPSAAILNMLKIAFNYKDDGTRQENLKMLEILDAGIGSLINGLTAQGVKLIAATRAIMYGRSYDMSDCTGLVPFSVKDVLNMKDTVEVEKDLSPTSGEIHLKLSGLPTIASLADTIIHEATHKFLGTVDYSYVGSAGKVEEGLNQRASDIRGGGLPGRPQDIEASKAQSKDRAYAQVAQSIVNNGIKDLFDRPDKKAAPIQQSDSEVVKAAKKAWKKVSKYGYQGPGGVIPLVADLRKTCKEIIEIPNIPSSVKSGLTTFINSKDREKYLAEHGNKLGVKGHDIFFTMSTKYLLKNADSWTEFIVILAK